MFAGRLETSGMIIVLFGHRVPDVPEMSIGVEL